MIDCEVNYTVNFSFDPKGWSLPFAFGVTQTSVLIGVLCFGIEVKRVKYLKR